MEKEIALVYMLGGVSSRFNRKIKALQQVGPKDETLLEYSLNQALPAGFSKIIFIVSIKTEQSFREKFGDSYKGIPIHYAIQSFDESSRDKPWGTGEAVSSAKHLLDSPFVVCNGDDIYGERSFQILYNHLSETEENASLGFILDSVLPKEEDKISNRGIFREQGGFVYGIKEYLGISRASLNEFNLTPNSMCSMNIFALTPEVLNLLYEEAEIFKKNNTSDRKVEIFLPETLSKFINQKKIVMKLYPLEESVFGITHPGDEIILKNKLSIDKI